MLINIFIHIFINLENLIHNSSEVLRTYSDLKILKIYRKIVLWLFEFQIILTQFFKILKICRLFYN